jgi:hypothetical protein
MSFEGTPAVQGADREHYRGEMIRMVDRVLDRATVRVACDPADPDTIVGWVAFTDGVLHWGFIKEAFREDCSLADLLEGVKIDAYMFKGRTLQRALVGVDGCDQKVDGDGRVAWVAPKGWKFTPRFTL